MNTRILHPRDQIKLIIDRIYRGGLTTTSGGNISIRDEDGDIWVTPSAVDKGTLRPQDIVCMTKSGKKTGPHKPSSEFPFHKAIYEIRPDIRAIIHAHPPALVSFSIVRQIPDTNIIPQAKYVCGPIGYADYELPGTDALGKSIAGEFKKMYNAVIMENHGVVVGGANLREAYERFETLEFSARTIINARIIGKPKFLTDVQLAAFDAQLSYHIPEMEKVVHPSNEREKRAEICTIVKRASDQGLMRSTYGTVSVRWEGNNFLITRTNFPRWNIQMEDVVQIKNGKKEPGKTPSRAVLLHQEIYEQNPDIHAIIFTQPPYLMAYGVSDRKIDVRTIPESWIFLQDVPKMPFGAQFKGSDMIPAKLSQNIPALLIENDSVLVTGKDLLQTFDRLEVAEFSARSLIMATALGNISPITDEQIEDLRKKFL